MFLPASTLLLSHCHRLILSRSSSLRLRRRQPFSTAALLTPPPPLEYTLSHPIYTIWGSNTGVGKTLVSTGLAASAVLSPSPTKFTYLKPVQTGFPFDSDSRYVFRKVSELFHYRRPLKLVHASNQVLKASAAAAEAVLGSTSCGEGESSGMRNLGFYEETKLAAGEQGPAIAYSELICKTMFGWREAVSPHLAAEREGGVVGDSVMSDMLQRCLEIGLREECKSKTNDLWTVVETAGGVASPGPSGSLQCDLYRCVLIVVSS